MDYKLISSTPDIAHIQFPGILNNNTVIWDATIQTLKSLAINKSNNGFKQFIEILVETNKLTSISIGLHVSEISKPEILKTIIMITNYKNLSLGRYEYGELYLFNN